MGLGGHSEALLRASPDVQVVGIDRDAAALARAGERLAVFGPRVRLVQANFHQITDALAGLGIHGGIAGFLADLGVSSLQLETPGRGFSFRLDGPLDMRMGLSDMTAADLVNQASEGELETIFREYGEERIDPATRVFQALRIEVNQELAGLERCIEETVRLLEADGRLVVISYHSLEDRIVKNTLRDLARGEVDPVTGRSRSETQLIEVLTRKPVRPTESELDLNPRARSGKLRAARRL